MRQEEGDRSLHEIKIGRKGEEAE